MGRKPAQYAKAESLLRSALAIRQRAQGPEHPDVASTLVTLAECLIVSLKKEAQAAGPMLEQALAICEKLNRKDDPVVARVLRGFYVWHMVREECDAAESALKRAVAIRESAFGPQSAEVAELLDDMGTLHLTQVTLGGIDFEAIRAKIAGEPKKESKSEKHAEQADSYYKRALTIREQRLKRNDPAIAATVLNLGMLAGVRGRLADGEPYFERWLDLYEKAKSPASKKQGQVLFMLALALRERKEFGQTERMLASAQTVCDQLSGAASDEALAVRVERASVAIEAGRFDDSERLLRQALAMQTKVIGADDPHVKQAGLLMAGGYQHHATNRRGYELWLQLELLAKQAREEHKHDVLQQILETYAELLGRTNHAVRRPTEEDLAYLKQVDLVFPGTTLESLLKNYSVCLLSEKRLDNQGLAHIAGLYHLERLRLSPEITDAGLAHIKDLTNLRELDLEEALITDAGMANLVDLKELEHLDLAFTRVGDRGMAHLQKLQKLRKFELAGTGITDAALEHLKGLENLRKLDVRFTKVTEAGVDRLWRARPDLVVRHTSREGFVLPDRPPGATK
jgi:tetratricopeptide (TPR) repeat protein